MVRTRKNRRKNRRETRGKLEGKEEEKLKIAKNMHKENYSVKEIAKITKLDCKTIEKLK